ncbi:MAG: hypothetical protein CR988_02020 [Treponema sp.]|nr:MAG: hypothetical protein CR988_02020 [Treponema sp.]
MKRAFIVLCFFAATSILAADPALGLWKSIDEKTGEVTGVWEVYTEGGKLFGKMLVCVGNAPDAAAIECTKDYPGFPKKGNVSNMPLVGTPFIFNLVKKSEGSWHKGNIIDPGNGKCYQCRIMFRKANGKKYKVDKLEMRGELALGIGRSQFWVRSSMAEVKSLTASNTYPAGYKKATE